MAMKRNDKESMIYFTPKPNQNKFRNDWNFLKASIKPRPSPSRLQYMGRFRKQNKYNKFTVLCLSSYFVYLLKIKINLAL